MQAGALPAVTMEARVYEGHSGQVHHPGRQDVVRGLYAEGAET